MSDNFKRVKCIRTMSAWNYPNSIYESFTEGNIYSVISIELDLYDTVWKIKDNRGKIQEIKTDIKANFEVIDDKSDIKYSECVKSFKFGFTGNITNPENNQIEQLSSMIYFNIGDIYEYKIIKMNHVQMLNRDHTLSVTLPFSQFDKYFKIINEEE